MPSCFLSQLGQIISKHPYQLHLEVSSLGIPSNRSRLPPWHTHNTIFQEIQKDSPFALKPSVKRFHWLAQQKTNRQSLSLSMLTDDVQRLLRIQVVCFGVTPCHLLYTADIESEISGWLRSYPLRLTRFLSLHTQCAALASSSAAH